MSRERGIKGVREGGERSGQTILEECKEGRKRRCKSREKRKDVMKREGNKEDVRGERKGFIKRGKRRLSSSSLPSSSASSSPSSSSSAYSFLPSISIHIC